MRKVGYLNSRRGKWKQVRRHRSLDPSKGQMHCDVILLIEMTYTQHEYIANNRTIIGHFLDRLIYDSSSNHRIKGSSFRGNGRNRCINNYGLVLNVLDFVNSFSRSKNRLHELEAYLNKIHRMIYDVINKCPFKCKSNTQLHFRLLLILRFVVNKKCILKHIPITSLNTPA